MYVQVCVLVCVLTQAFSTRSLADLVCTPVHYMYPTCTYIELSGSDSAFTAPSVLIYVRPFSHISHIQRAHQRRSTTKPPLNDQFGAVFGLR